MIENNTNANRLIILLSGRTVTAETFSETDWQRIVELAQEQGVAPLLYAWLKESGRAPSSAIAQRLREIYLASALRNMRLFQELANILHALQAIGIPAIPLKGACLAEVVYGNIALRPMGDVDLLVKPADLAKALDVLYTLGYAAENPFEIESERQFYPHMPELSKRGGVRLELHWTIVNPRNNTHFDDLTLDQIWSRATPAKIGGVQALMLSPMDLLLHLCSHASVWHRFEGIGLRHFWDMALVIRRYGDEIDWEQFTWCANQWSMASGVCLALKLTEEWTDVVVPAPVIHSLLPVTPDDAAIEWARHKVWNRISPALQRRTDVARLGKERIPDKLAAIRDRLFPSRHEMATLYHIPANSWRILCYYPVRFKDLLITYGQAIWQLIWRDKTLTAEARQEAHLREYLGWD
ncbi:MAG: nucleotidyltransferase family protein [Chloroflexi bacterium]|nr:nucleotidyltransferase family protein [Chloroflexota bacterium]